MKSIIFRVFITFISQTYSQIEEFQYTTLLYFNYVDNQACDHPHNIAYFHKYGAYESLHYQVRLSKDSLWAKRNFYAFN